MKKLFLILAFGALCFILLIYCYFNFQFWNHYRTHNFLVLIEYKGINIKGYRGNQILIHKEFKKYLEQVDQYAISNNIEIYVHHGYRSQEKILKNTIVKPVEFSNHIVGFAIDFNIKCNGNQFSSKDLKKNNFDKLPDNIKNFINDIRKNKNLRWGGDFRNEDPIHVDNPLNIKDRSAWNDCNKTCALDYSKKIPLWKFWE